MTARLTRLAAFQNPEFYRAQSMRLPHGIELAVDDRRERVTPLAVSFLGKLRDEQAAALKALAKHDIGILAATTAFGKTAVAAALIAQRQSNTLILVHRRESCRASN